MRFSNVPIADVAREIHAHWRARREAAGWRFGAYDRAARSSPYLKPFDDFSPQERLREQWLALGDTIAVAKACHAQLAEFRIDPKRLRSALPALQANDDGELLVCARFVHRMWRIVNRRFHLVDDPRMQLCFDNLSAEDRKLTLDNLRADMNALAAFAWPQRMSQLTLESEMLADRQTWERLVTAARQPLT